MQNHWLCIHNGRLSQLVIQAPQDQHHIILCGQIDIPVGSFSLRERHFPQVNDYGDLHV